MPIYAYKYTEMYVKKTEKKKPTLSFKAIIWFLPTQSGTGKPPFLPSPCPVERNILRHQLPDPP